MKSTALRVVSPEVPATDLRDIADRIRARLRRTTEDILATGNDLIAVKGRLDHGEFLKWLAAEFSWTDRTARRYIAAAEWAGSKSDTVSILPTNTVYKLSAPTTPQAIKDKVIADLEAGEKVDVRAVDEEIRLAQHHARYSRPLSQIRAEEKRRKAQRRGKLTPEAEKRIARQQAKDAEAEQRKQVEEKAIGAEMVSIFAKLSAVDRTRLHDLLQQHVSIFHRVVLPTLRNGGAA